MIKPLEPNTINFGYKSILKDEYRKGNIPITKGFYGGKLSPKNVSLEHCQAHCKGGKSNLANYVLTTAENNMKRGKADIFQYATKENTEAYFKVFENCDIGTVKGTDYLAMISKTLRKLWKQSPLTKKEDMWEVLKRY